MRNSKRKAVAQVGSRNFFASWITCWIWDKGNKNLLVF